MDIGFALAAHIPSISPLQLLVLLPRAFPLTLALPGLGALLPGAFARLAFPLLTRRDQLPGSLLAVLLRLRPLLARRDQLPGVLLAALLRPLLLCLALLGRCVRYWSVSSPRIRLLIRSFSSAVIASHIPR